MPKPTIHDVAKRAGVSIKTVSRVINLEPNVRESTKAAVEKAIGELNYRPDQSARSLKSRRSYLIGLLYDDPSCYDIPSSGYVVNMQQGLLAACKAASYDLLIHPCDYRNSNIGKELRTMIEQNRPVGIVLAPPLSNMRKITRAINDTGVPFIRIAPGSNHDRPSSVATNDREACAEMVRYLVSLGHKRIGFVAGNPEHRAVVSRLEGYRDGLGESGIRISERLIVQGDNSIRSGEDCAKKLLDRASPPTAIFCANDDMAAGVLRVAQSRGIDVPDQLSIAGFDDIALAQQVFPALTTIKQPLEEMSEQAGQMLIEHLAGKPLPKKTEIVPATLIVRESTGPAPQ